MILFAMARLAAAVALSLLGMAVLAQEKVPALEEIKNQAELDQAIGELDRQLFDAYNHCDLKKFDNLLADDVEFYHDQGGVTLGHQKLTDSIKNNICTGDTQRVLVPRHAQDLLHEGLRSDRDGRAPVLARKDGSNERDGRGELCSFVAVQRRGVEDHAGVELRSSLCRGETIAYLK